MTLLHPSLASPTTTDRVAFSCVPIAQGSSPPCVHMQLGLMMRFYPHLKASYIFETRFLSKIVIYNQVLFFLLLISLSCATMVQGSKLELSHLATEIQGEIRQKMVLHNDKFGKGIESIPCGCAYLHGCVHLITAILDLGLKARYHLNLDGRIFENT